MSETMEELGRSNEELDNEEQPNILEHKSPKRKYNSKSLNRHWKYIKDMLE